jgi:hypothetical protein
MSHPQLKERMERLIQNFPELNTAATVDSISDSFRSIRKIAGFERFSSLDLSEEYGFGVYLCLINMNRKNLQDADFYEFWLGKFMNKIHGARKTYTLNRHLDKVDSKNQPRDYQQFLNFMWNLKVGEMETIARHYQNKTKDKI